MNRNLLLLFLAMALSIGVSAQSGMTPSVIASAGSSSQPGKTRLDWTLGETAVAAITTRFGMLTEGFHQPKMLEITPVEDTQPDISETSGSAAITIAPNPVQTRFTLHIPQDWSLEPSEVSLYDAWGKPIQMGEILPGEATSEWDMSMHPAGTYWLRIATNDSHQVQTFKVIKIH